VQGAQFLLIAFLLQRSTLFALFWGRLPFLSIGFDLV
jgi:hypothetical protein